MPKVSFTSHLSRFVEAEPREVAGETVRAALDNALAGNEQLRGYLLDDHNRLRRHVMIFLDGQIITDPNTLSDPTRTDSEIYVMQALSGG